VRRSGCLIPVTVVAIWAFYTTVALALYHPLRNLMLKA
jgi:hypothetical protein